MKTKKSSKNNKVSKKKIIKKDKTKINKNKISLKDKLKSKDKVDKRIKKSKKNIFLIVLISIMIYYIVQNLQYFMIKMDKNLPELVQKIVNL